MDKQPVKQAGVLLTDINGKKKNHRRKRYHETQNHQSFAFDDAHFFLLSVKIS